MDHMLHAITPSQEKLEKKGIQSVRQRITLLKDYLTEDNQPKSVEELKTFIRETLCDGEYVLTQADVAEIELLEQNYLKEEFINLIQQ